MPTSGQCPPELPGGPRQGLPTPCCGRRFSSAWSPPLPLPWQLLALGSPCPQASPWLGTRKISQAHSCCSVHGSGACLRWRQGLCWPPPTLCCQNWRLGTGPWVSPRLDLWNPPRHFQPQATCSKPFTLGQQGQSSKVPSAYLAAASLGLGGEPWAGSGGWRVLALLPSAALGDGAVLGGLHASVLSLGL